MAIDRTNLASRPELLRQLIEYCLPIESTLADLSTYGWDSVEPLVTLTAKDIRSALIRYLNAELDSAQLTDWANLIECREDIDVGPNTGTFSNIIFRLANPNLNTAVTPELAHELLTLL